MTDRAGARMRRIQAAGGKGEADRRRPVGCAQAEVIGVQITRAGIAGQADRSPKLEGMRLPGPRQIILQVVQAYLEIVAVNDSLIQPQEFVPGLVGISDDAKALPRKSPEKRICEIGVEHRGIAESKAFAVVDVGLFRRIARQKRSARVAYILECSTPEQQVPAVCCETVIKAGDEDIVVQFGGCAENESGVIEAIAGGKIVGYRPTIAEGLIEITGVIG